jgi:hypothetical protein
MNIQARLRPLRRPVRIGRQGGRQQHAPRQRGGRRAGTAADFDQLAVDAAHARHHAHVDREEGADGDQDSLGFVDA